MSLENRALGWETPYTITPSAISSWIGEEIRTVGPRRPGRLVRHALSATISTCNSPPRVFGWNDPAGTMLAAHGFALHDRQTTLVRPRRRAADRTPRAQRKSCSTRSTIGPASTSARRRAISIAPCSTSCTTTIARIRRCEAPEIRDFAWLTKFDAAALRVETGNGWTVARPGARWETYIAPGGFWLDWEFDFAVRAARQTLGAHMLAARYDAVRRESSWTTRTPHRAARTDTPGRSRTPSIAAITGASRSNGCASRATCRRAVSLGEPAFATESKIELSARYLLSGSF